MVDAYILMVVCLMACLMEREDYSSSNKEIILAEITLVNFEANFQVGIELASCWIA